MINDQLLSFCEYELCSPMTIEGLDTVHKITFKLPMTNNQGYPADYTGSACIVKYRAILSTTKKQTLKSCTTYQKRCSARLFTHFKKATPNLKNA